MLTPAHPNNISSSLETQREITMPATITPRGHVRVCHNGFDDTLTAWRNKKLKDYPDTREWLCDLFNKLIFADNFHPENWFPKEKKKYLFGTSRLIRFFIKN